MRAKSANSKNHPGVSIITCTNRHGYVRNLFRNYHRQRLANKELIIIVNNNHIPLLPYRQLAKLHNNVQIYRLPEHYSLGKCLNFAVTKAKYGYIAKFDDDDYYAPYYLRDSLQAFKRTKADIIGKRAHYMYLRGSKTLLLRFPQDENRYVTLLPGATLVMKRSVLDNVPFPDRSVGEDDQFCVRSKKSGYKIYSAGKYNFVAIRRKNSFKHTWKISDRELIAHHRKIAYAGNFKRFIQRTPKGASK